MNRRLENKLRLWILGTAATGLLMPTTAVFGQIRTNAPATKKKPSVAKVTEPPQLLSVPANVSGPANQIQPVSEMEVASSDKTDVQRELEALYQQDGREMPALNLQPLTPIPGPNGQQSNATTPQPTQPGPRTTQTKQNATQYPPSANPAFFNQPNQNRGAATPYPVQPQAPTQRYTGLFDDNAAAQPQPQQAPKKPTSKFNFFKRLTGSNKPAAPQSPVPPDFRDIPMAQPIPAVPPASAANVAATPNAPQGMQPMKYFSPSQQPPQIRPGNQPMPVVTNSIPAQLPASNIPNVITLNTVPELPQPTMSLPVLYQTPLPLLSAPTQPTLLDDSALPPLMTEAQSLRAGSTTNIIAPSPLGGPAIASDRIANATVDLSNDFPNPFPEASEAEADGRPVRMPRRREIPANTYVDDVSPKSTPAQPTKPETPSVAASTPDEDPFAVGAKDFAEPTIRAKVLSLPPKSDLPPKNDPPAKSDDNEFLPPIVSGNAEPQKEIPNHPLNEKIDADAKLEESDIAKILGAPRVEDSRPATEPKPVEPSTEPGKGSLTPPTAEEEQHIEKMRKIRERFGMKGLKGFCPVTLHDERDLIDAKPEFFAVHRSQKFHFASAEAREKFEADPVKYAPAAYGADVVALGRDREVVEGTLDFAAWFKGRLYLFGTQENYDVFIENPAKFATLSGIE